MEEIKGEGMKATDKEGNLYQAGAYKIAAHLTQDDTHNIYVLENGKLVGFIDGADVKEGIDHYLEEKQVDLVVMSTHKKTILERLFMQSNTKLMAMQTKVPLLVYHKE